MTRRLAAALALAFSIARPAGAQSAAAACGATTDTTAHHFIRVYGDLRLCMLAFTTDSSAVEGPRAWSIKSSRIVYETQRENDFRRMAIAGDVVEWTINGRPRAADSAAMAWREGVIGVLAPAWEAARLRDEVSRLRLHIDSLPALRQRAMARMDSIDQAVTRARARIASLQASDRAIRSDIANYEKRLRDLDAEAGRQRAIANSPDPRVRERAEAALRAIEGQQRGVDDGLRGAERRREALDAERQIGAIELDIREMRPDHQRALLKLELGELDEENVPLLEQELVNLDAPNRLRYLDDAAEKALARLRASLPPTP